MKDILFVRSTLAALLVASSLYADGPQPVANPAAPKPVVAQAAPTVAMAQDAPAQAAPAQKDYVVANPFAASQTPSGVSGLFDSLLCFSRVASQQRINEMKERAAFAKFVDQLKAETFSMDSLTQEEQRIINQITPARRVEYINQEFDALGNETKILLHMAGAAKNKAITIGCPADKDAAEQARLKLVATFATLVNRWNLFNQPGGLLQQAAVSFARDNELNPAVATRAKKDALTKQLNEIAGLIDKDGQALETRRAEIHAATAPAKRGVSLEGGAAAPVLDLGKARAAFDDVQAIQARSAQLKAAQAGTQELLKKIQAQQTRGAAYFGA